MQFNAKSLLRRPVYFLRGIVSTSPRVFEFISNLRSTWGFFGRSRLQTPALARTKADLGRILFVDLYTPEPDKNAGAVTMLQFMGIYCEHGWEVYFWPLDRDFRGRYGETLMELGVTVLSAKNTFGSFKSWWIENSKDFDLILLSRPICAAITLPAVKQYGLARVIYYGHDLHFQRITLESVATGKKEQLLLAERFKKLEMGAWRYADIILYPSEEEVRLVRELAPYADVRFVTPYISRVSEMDTAKLPIGQRLLIVGNFRHSPNVDALQWVLEGLWSEILKRSPGAELVVVGGSIPSELKSRLSELRRVVVLGWLSEEALSLEYEKCRVVLAPLRFGAGVKYKVVQALQSGRPVITTSIGLQGLDESSPALLRADSAEEFAILCSQLLIDSASWFTLSNEARQLALKKFSADSMWACFQDLATANPPTS
jgi:O-antigen biosynthesis protein